MKQIIFFILAHSYIFSQTAFHNFGNVQIHNEGEIGFHINLINDGVFNENLGFTGFYNTVNSLSISGTQIPRFFDMDVSVNDNLFLDINTEVLNSLSFTDGDIITPRETPSVSLDFLDNALPILESDDSHTDGYASVSYTHLTLPTKA